MNKSVRKLYELDRSYDFGDYWSPAGKSFNKRRAHRRLRQMLKPKMTEICLKNKVDVDRRVIDGNL